MPNLAEFLRGAERRLAEAGVDNPGLDARILLAHALETDRARILAAPERALSPHEESRAEVLVKSRARREPVSRILHEREFHGLMFGLNEATLDPRPDSETLIDAAVDKMPKQPARILDLGTGTGCLLLALLHELPNASGLGVDCAPRATEQARHNAEKLGLGGRAEFRVGNWAEGVAERFDCVISNPPYIPHKEIPKLMPEVRDYDPHLALDGGADGLCAYRILIPRLPDLLAPGGIAVFETGEGQMAAVSALFQRAGFKKIETRRDLGGIERCAIAYMP